MGNEALNRLIEQLDRVRVEREEQVAEVKATLYALTKPLALALEYAIGYSDPISRRCSREDAFEHITAMPDREELLAALRRLNEAEQEVTEVDAQIAGIRSEESGERKTTPHDSDEPSAF